MTTSASRRASDAATAINAVMGGATPQLLETETLDFKEEAGVVDPRTGTRRPIPPNDDRAAAALAAEAACMANSEAGGTLVVGVADDVAGRAAFTGSHLDVAWLRRRIWDLTTPHLSLDEFDVQVVAGARIYLIDVPPNLEEIYVNGRLRARFGAACEEVTGSRAQQLLERRRGFDWTAEPSGLRFSDATADALASARRHYAEESGVAPGSELEVARRMGVVVTGDDQDPELNRAGALLLTAFEAAHEQLVLLIASAEGAPARHIVRGPAPLLVLFDAVVEALRDDAFPSRPEIVGVQRRSTRAVPEAAFREAIVNAVMHRDYRQGASSIFAWATGDPGRALKVRSPGGLPAGVSLDRLIATPSRPRNPALARALRVLGIAETEGIGIDTMVRLMLHDGHPEPEITEDAGDVVVVLRGGRPDAEVRSLFEEIARRDPELDDDARAAIAVTRLTQSPILRPEALAGPAQCTDGEALDLLQRLAAAGIAEPRVRGSRSFRLTEPARQALASRIAYQTRRGIEAHWELVQALLDTRSEISTADVQGLLKVSQPRASQIVTTFLRDGRLTYASARRRGPGVRYRRGS